MPQSTTNFSPIGAAETVWRTFDYSRGLAPGESLVSASVTIAVESGTDPTPASRLIQGPVVTGPTVSILIGTMVAGVVYTITITASSTNSQELELWTYQLCEAA